MTALSLEPNGKTYHQIGRALNAARARKISRWSKSEIVIRHPHEWVVGNRLAGFDDDQNHNRNESDGRYFID
jgi:endonuclease YncB( thermonuclease family)